MKIKGTVTDKHVHKGKCESSEKCAVALALLDIGFRCVCVNDDQIYFRDNHGVSVTAIKTTKRLERFINQFDDIEDDYNPNSDPEKEKTDADKKVARLKLAARLKAHPIPFSITLPREDFKAVLKPAVFKKLDGR